MSAIRPRVNGWLVWFHRWAGVVLCLVVAAWFVSGAILHFVPYPALSRAEQLARSERLDVSRIHIDPATALGRVPQAVNLRLLSSVGRPTYIARTPANRSVRVAADTGEVLSPLSAAMAQAVAERFAGARAMRVTGPLANDQWTVHQRFDRYRPLFRVRIDDADRTDLYVSASTGEIVQRTRFAERLWNWPGAVLHWTYFTPLRSNWSAWNETVWWLSLITLVSASVGIYLGVDRLIANRSAGRSGLSPFRGWMRWHHVIGLFASVIVFGWIFSGWLSMDHGRMFSKGQATPEQQARVTGLSLSAAAAAVPVEELQTIGRATEISVHAIGGQPLLTVETGDEASSHVVWLGGGGRTSAISDSFLIAALRGAWSDAEPASERFDEMYRLAEHLPDHARGFVSIKDRSSRIYVEPLTGEILVVMDPSRRVYAWIYYALHTLNFPGLISRPVARTTIELLLLAAGLGFGVTGIVLAVRRLRRELAH